MLWWIAFAILICAALLLGIGWIVKAARNDTKHSPKYERIKRAVDDSERQERDRR